jgi:archaemetzincin
MTKTIYVLPLGVIEPALLGEISRGINLAFGYQVEIMAITTNPSYAFEARRQQYYSGKILEKLTQKLPSDGAKIIGVTSVDLATPVLTFVFGEAQLNGTASVISINRLRQEFYELIPNQKLLIHRTVKETIHELGHTFGLLHCSDSECVMHFSSNITGIDQKDVNFCTKCLQILQNQI